MKSRIYFFNWFQFAFDDGYFSDRCLVVEVPMKFILIMKRFQISLPTFFWVPRAFPKMIYWAQFSKKKEWTVFLIAFVRLQPIMYYFKLWSKINLTSFRYIFPTSYDILNLFMNLTKRILSRFIYYS